MKNIGDYETIVNGTKTLTQLVKECSSSNGDHLNEKDFPIKDGSNRKVTISLFDFKDEFNKGEKLSDSSIVYWMKEKGYRPTFTEELLSLKIAHPDLYCGAGLVSLGSKSTTSFLYLVVGTEGNVYQSLWKFARGQYFHGGYFFPAVKI